MCPAPGKASREPDLLRFTTAGSVDDGKSTLIGRLLLETGGLPEDQLAALRRASGGGEPDLALVTDGLRAEREQKITIDVAYRHFATSRRRFIIADTPGHEQYTRNMVTGASTADLAVIVLDARRGVLTQTLRHAFIASLLGIRQVVFAINKMDLMDWSQEVFDEIVEQLRGVTARLTLGDIRYMPVSALNGDNVVHPSTRMPWYEGGSLLHHLETVSVDGRNLIDLRFPVQYVNRPDQGFRGYCGQVASGVLRTGDEVLVLPGGVRTRVRSVHVAEELREEAFAPQSITVGLEDEVDVSRGDMIVHPGNVPRVERELDAMLVWMSETPLATDRPYLVQGSARQVRGYVSRIRFRVDPNTFHREDIPTLALNEIGRVTLQLYQPLVFDEYQRNRVTGSFVLIDAETYDTVAAGMIIDRGRYSPGLRDIGREEPVSQNISVQEGTVKVEDRQRLLGQTPATLWLTGLPGSGKSTLAYALEARLTGDGHACFVLDGDNLRHGLNRDLGFSPTDRRENIRRVAEVAHLLNEAGLIAITAFVSPYRDDRASAREIIGVERFIEAFVDAPLALCEERDPKGLYRRARAGEIEGLTGLSAPYEEPKSPDLHLLTGETSPDGCVEKLIQALVARGVLPHGS